MIKKIVSVFFSVLIISFAALIPASAYEPTGFDINAKNVILASLDTNEILYSKGADERVFPASITKIMTVTLMLESPLYDPNAKVAMTEQVMKLISGTGSSVSNLRIGEEITQLDLVYLVLMASFGDCAYLAALTYADSIEAFVDMMNSKAAELGLKGTHYSNPVGLHDPDNYTTASDTLTLASYALGNPTFKQVCETVRYTLPATNFSSARTISTTNFLQDPATNYYYTYAKGVKTGYTDEAGRCLVSTAEYNGYRYICILFGCTPNAGKRFEFVDSKNLYRWALNNFEFKQVANTDSPVGELSVELSLDTDFVPLYIAKSFVSVLPKDADFSTMTVKIHPDSETVDAPIKKGEVLGKADIIYAEKVIGTVDIVAGESVKRSNLLYGLRFIKNIFTSIYMKLIFAVAAILIIIFIILVIKMNSGRSKKRRVKYVPYRKNERYDENEND